MFQRIILGCIERLGFWIVVVVFWILIVHVELCRVNQKVVQDDACSNPAGNSSFVVHVFNTNSKTSETASTALEHAVGMLDKDAGLGALVIEVFLGLSVSTKPHYLPLPDQAPIRRSSF